MPRLGKLPSDAQGHPRFYIDGAYAQSAGGTIGAQISVWLWDGRTVQIQIARAYTFTIGQTVEARVEGDLLKVQEKKFFYTFSSCGGCEERQTDWTLRLAPGGVEDLGEKSLVPELDVADELLFRVIQHKPAADIASKGAVNAAESIVQSVRETQSLEDWEKSHYLGMLLGWKVFGEAGHNFICVSIDGPGTFVFTLQSKNNRLFISDLKPTEQTCEK